MLRARNGHTTAYSLLIDMAALIALAVAIVVTLGGCQRNAEALACFDNVYWIAGGVDPQKYAEAERTGSLNKLPSNHSPEFAPVINPTLRTGVEGMLAAAGVWLVPPGTR